MQEQEQNATPDLVRLGTFINKLLGFSPSQDDIREVRSMAKAFLTHPDTFINKPLSSAERSTFETLRTNLKRKSTIDDGMKPVIRAAYDLTQLMIGREQSETWRYLTSLSSHFLSPETGVTRQALDQLSQGFKAFTQEQMRRANYDLVQIPCSAQTL